MDSLKKLIGSYKEEYKKSSSDVELRKIKERFMLDCQKVVGAEEEIVTYLEEGLSSRKWENESDWFLLAIHVWPSSKYMPYFFDIVTTPDPTFPHYYVLNVLGGMPESMKENMLLDLVKFVEEHGPNPAWGEDVIYCYCETMYFFEAEETINSILKLQHCSNEKIAKAAYNYVMEFYLDEID